MNPKMLIQVPFLCKGFPTVGTVERSLLGMFPKVDFKLLWSKEPLRTVNAMMLLLSFMYDVVVPQTAERPILFTTPFHFTFKWPLSSVDSHMSFQVHICCESLTAEATFVVFNP